MKESGLKIQVFLIRVILRSRVHLRGLARLEQIRVSNAISNSKLIGFYIGGFFFDKFYPFDRKLVGGRYFGTALAASQGTTLKDIVNGCGDFLSPRDYQGHGSHVSSIAAGGIVSTASIGGVNFGSARGVAYGARIAAYKVFWCAGDGTESDVASAIDSAVKDGVDVLSLSLGKRTKMWKSI